MSNDKKSEFTCPECGGHAYGSHQLEDGTLERLCHGYVEKVPELPKASDGVVPRRYRIDLLTPAEKAIQDAVDAVEAAGADERLTNAVILLGNARELVSDFVDGVHRPAVQSCGFTWHQRDDEKYGILPPEPGEVHAVGTCVNERYPTHLKIEIVLDDGVRKRAVVEAHLGCPPVVMYYGSDLYTLTNSIPPDDVDTSGVYAKPQVVRRVW